MQDIISPSDTPNIAQAQYPSWIPVLFGLISPLSFTAYAMLAKNLSSERVGFDPTTLTFSTFIGVNLLILIFAIPYWVQHGFVQKFFWLGFVGNFVDSVGLVAVTEAFACGPAGPVAAICSTTNLLMVLIEAIKHHRMLTKFELIGFILAVIGNIVIILPDYCEKYCFCLCIKKKKNNT